MASFYPPASSAPSGPAGGALSGTYPNPALVSPVATDPLTLSGAITIGKTLAVTNAITAEGNAVAESPAAVYVDKTASRVMGTIYRPNVNRPTLVVASIQCGISEQCLIYIDTNAAPAIVVAQLYNEPGAGSIKIWPITFLVPPGSYYKFTQNSGTPSFNRLYEYTL